MTSNFPFFLQTEPRPLTTEEYEIAECLVSGLDESFKKQLPTLTVVGRCGCGNCPTIFFQPSQDGDQERDLIACQGTDSGKNIVVAVLLQKEGVLSQLEFYALCGSSWSIPDPKSLVPLTQAKRKYGWEPRALWALGAFSIAAPCIGAVLWWFTL